MAEIIPQDSSIRVIDSISTDKVQVGSSSVTRINQTTNFNGSEKNIVVCNPTSDITITLWPFVYAKQTTFYNMSSYKVTIKSYGDVEFRNNQNNAINNGNEWILKNQYEYVRFMPAGNKLIVEDFKRNFRLMINEESTPDYLINKLKDGLGTKIIETISGIEISASGLSAVDIISGVSGITTSVTSGNVSGGLNSSYSPEFNGMKILNEDEFFINYPTERYSELYNDATYNPYASGTFLSLVFVNANFDSSTGRTYVVKNTVGSALYAIDLSGTFVSGFAASGILNFTVEPSMTGNFSITQTKIDSVNGKIIVLAGGQYSAPVYSKSVLIRLSTSGAYDTSLNPFGAVPGFVSFQHLTGTITLSRLTDCYIDTSTEDVYVCGFAYDGSGTNFRTGFSKINSSGGIVFNTVLTGTYSSPKKIEKLGDSFYIWGTTPDYSIIVSKWDASGVADTNFNSGLNYKKFFTGLFSFDYNGNDTGNTNFHTAGTDIFACGGNSSPQVIRIAKFNVSGTTDASFASGGIKSQSNAQFSNDLESVVMFKPSSISGFNSILVGGGRRTNGFYGTDCFIASYKKNTGQEDIYNFVYGGTNIKQDFGLGNTIFLKIFEFSGSLYAIITKEGVTNYHNIYIAKFKNSSEFAHALYTLKEISLLAKQNIL